MRKRQPGNCSIGLALLISAPALLQCGSGDAEPTPPTLARDAGPSVEASGAAGSGGAGGSTDNAGSSATGGSSGSLDAGAGGSPDAGAPRTQDGEATAVLDAGTTPEASAGRDASVPSDAAGASDGPTTTTAPDKPRVVVTTDVSNEPDDEESLVRYLVYANEFDTEAMIAVTSQWLRSGPRPDLIKRDITAYGQVRANLSKHATGYPDAAALLALTAAGQTDFGMAATGAGKSTDGSKLLIKVVDKADPRPVWITLWGGANTLAQALIDVSATRSAAEVAAFVAKMRVYSISDQDDAGAWVRKQYPQLEYIVSPGSDYTRATWSGISGDRWYKNGPMYKFDLVDNPWLTDNVINNHGPLGALYPKLKYIMEGDTPSWLGLINNGLGWSVSPSYGGWGGRYARSQPSGEARPIWTNDQKSTADSVLIDDGSTVTSDQATIWRWREQYQYDFAARMNWCVADTLAKANHNPIAVVNGDNSKGVEHLAAKAGSTVDLSSQGTSDPDGNTTKVSWWVYREAGTLPGAKVSAASGASTTVQLPATQTAGTVHVIMQVDDSGTPKLTAYRRVVIDVTP